MFLPVPKFRSKGEHGLWAVAGALGEPEEGVVLHAALPQVLAGSPARRLETVSIFRILPIEKQIRINKLNTSVN